eukprot:TRINITY_DN549_c2_g1_i2.p2 TRINITY_DN549_c2_g1~~TRINITY_DN549_c2_g1_i2.p2  ORF type:complete len:471 (-),score=93.86 TRINITY_DN549_c2_g1_i2:1628-3040(-)
MEKSHEFASSQQKALLNLRSSVERFTQAKNDELVLVDSQLCALRSCVEKLANDVSNSTNQFGEVLSHVHEESQGFVSNIKSSHENARQAQHQAICSAAAAFERLVEEQRQVVGNWRSQTAAEATKICNTVDDFRTQQEAIFNQIHSVVLNYEKKQCASLQKSQNELSTLLLSQHKARKMHIERIGQELQLLSNEHQNDIECILRSREASNKEHVQVLDSQSKEISLLENTLKDASTSGLQQLREYALGVNRSVDSREAANLREQEGFLAAFRAHQEYLDDLSNRSSSQLERVIQSSESSRKESDHQLSVLVGQLTSSTSSDNQEFASSTRTLHAELSSRGSSALKAFSRTRDQISTLSESGQSFHSGLNEHFGNLASGLRSFRLKKYIPTGMTPAKKQYALPTDGDFVHTPSSEDIIQKAKMNRVHPSRTVENFLEELSPETEMESEDDIEDKRELSPIETPSKRPRLME